MTDKNGTLDPANTQPRFRPGIDDALLLPAAVVAAVATQAGRIAFSILVHILDWCFPLLLQLARLPLFTARMAGDGVLALAKAAIACVPVPAARRAAWRERITARWIWLRKRISYTAFEEAVHHAFEGGMAWVFRTCRTLTPGGAVLVLAGAVLWLPISFGVATAMHAVLLAKAAALPAILQLLHPVATIIAKSKLLVLPVYPAAWPQARRHPFIDRSLALWRYLAGSRLARKLAHRYRQVHTALGRAGRALRGAAGLAGRTVACREAWLALCSVAGWIGNAGRGTAARLRAAPVVGPIIESYAAHYERAARPAERTSARIRSFFARWSIKLTPEYYEAKEIAATRRTPT